MDEFALLNKWYDQHILGKPLDIEALKRFGVAFNLLLGYNLTVKAIIKEAQA